jgi:MoxR-like ATPase
MTPTEAISDIEAVGNLRSAHEKIRAEIGKVIVGQDKVIEQLLISLLSSGHSLLVGVPGLAKTLMISTLARVLSLKFNRIQFTPDLMPSDITGTEIIEEDHTTGKRQFRFVRGPVFANIILADEINRTPPKTQAALLQAMQEHAEAQLDRFMFNVIVDYPSDSEEEEIVKTTTTIAAHELDEILTAKDIIGFQQLVRRVPVSDHLVHYAVQLVRATRPNEKDAPDFIKKWVNWGAGPRASQYLILAAKAKAILEGRPTPGPEDVKFAAYPVMRHRIVTSFNAEADGVDSIEIIRRVLGTVNEQA